MNGKPALDKTVPDAEFLERLQNANHYTIYPMELDLTFLLRVDDEVTIYRSRSLYDMTDLEQNQFLSELERITHTKSAPDPASSLKLYQDFTGGTPISPN